MELVDLLDKIDATAPISCQTCVHMAMGYSGPCGNCLGPAGAESYLYKNHKPGNWLRALQAAEESGIRSIVIGGQGEAEVNANDSPDATEKNLHYVAEQCGYYVGKLHRDGGGVCLDIQTSEGRFRIVWAALTRKLMRIDRVREDGMSVRTWPHFIEAAAATA